MTAADRRVAVVAILALHSGGCSEDGNGLAPRGRSLATSASSGGSGGTGATTGGGEGPTGGRGGGGGGAGGRGGEGGGECTVPFGEPGLSAGRNLAEALQAAGCSWELALDYCVVLFQLGACTSEVSAFVECGGLGSCAGGQPLAPCAAENDAMTQCLGPLPPDPTVYYLEKPDGTCHAWGLMAGSPGPFVEAACVPDTNGQLACNCSIDGEPVGSCAAEPDVPWPACELYVGCCPQFWQCAG